METNTVTRKAQNARNLSIDFTKTHLNDQEEAIMHHLSYYPMTDIG